MYGEAQAAFVLFTFLVTLDLHADAVLLSVFAVEVGEGHGDWLIVPVVLRK